MDFAKNRLKNLVERYPDLHPMYTMNGRWRHSGEPWTHWCDGFLPGMLWIVAARQPDDPEGRWWAEQAIRYSQPLEPRQHDRDVHDLGFIFMSTYYRWHRFAPDPKLNGVLTLRIRNVVRLYAGSANAGDRPSLRRFLHRAHACQRGSPMGLRRATR